MYLFFRLIGTEYLPSFVEINKKQSIIHRVEKIVF